MVLTRARLEPFLFEIGWTRKALDEAERKLSATPDPEVQMPLFQSVVVQAVEHKRPKSLHELSQLVREFQAFCNHVVIVDPPCEHITRFLETAALSRDEMGRHKPADWSAFAQLTLQAHQQIDQYLDQYLESGLKAAEEMERYLEQLHQNNVHYPRKRAGSQAGLTERFTKERDLAASCAHYALDWYMMASPHTAYRKEPQRLAAIALHVVQHINRYVVGHDVLGPLRELADFAGYATPSSMSQAGQSAFYDVVYAMSDPSLLLVRADQVPDDWEERLYALVPGLREGEADDFGSRARRLSRSCGQRVI